MLDMHNESERFPITASGLLLAVEIEEIEGQDTSLSHTFANVNLFRDLAVICNNRGLVEVDLLHDSQVFIWHTNIVEQMNYFIVCHFIESFFVVNKAQEKVLLHFYRSFH